MLVRSQEIEHSIPDIQNMPTEQFDSLLPIITVKGFNNMLVLTGRTTPIKQTDAGIESREMKMYMQVFPGFDQQTVAGQADDRSMKEMVIL